MFLRNRDLVACMAWHVWRVQGRQDWMSYQLHLGPCPERTVFSAIDISTVPGVDISSTN
jgi:hypothetical protein